MIDAEIEQTVKTIFARRRNLHSGIGYRKVMEVADENLARMCYDSEGLDYWTEKAHVHVFLHHGMSPTIDVVVDDVPVFAIFGDVVEMDYPTLSDRWTVVGPILIGLAEVCA